MMRNQTEFLLTNDCTSGKWYWIFSSTNGQSLTSQMEGNLLYPKIFDKMIFIFLLHYLFGRFVISVYSHISFSKQCNHQMFILTISSFKSKTFRQDFCVLKFQDSKIATYPTKIFVIMQSSNRFKTTDSWYEYLELDNCEMWWYSFYFWSF